MLEVEGLTLAFCRYDGLLRRRRMEILAGLDVTVSAGEVVAVFGASGAGKTLLAHAVLGILPHNAEISGTLRFRGETLTPDRQRAARGREIALVPQSVAFLDPLARAGAQARWAARRAGISASKARAAVDARFAHHGLDAKAAACFPHMLSGGMARRVMLAMATVADAQLIIADEPTTGLDPETLATVLDALRALADQGKGVLLITHDMPAAARVADRMVVLRDGLVVDRVAATAFRDGGAALTHPYTRALWRALPRNGFGAPAAIPEDERRHA